jgi:hypothetical protein
LPAGPALVEASSMVENSGREMVLGSRAQSTGARIMDMLHQLHL